MMSMSSATFFFFFFGGKIFYFHMFCLQSYVRIILAFGSFFCFVFYCLMCSMDDTPKVFSFSFHSVARISLILCTFPFFLYIVISERKGSVFFFFFFYRL